jgi:hypothetical protein
VQSGRSCPLFHLGDDKIKIPTLTSKGTTLGWATRTLADVQRNGCSEGEECRKLVLWPFYSSYEFPSAKRCRPF